MKISKGEKIFNFVNYIFLVLFGLAMVIPLLSVLSISLSSASAVYTGKVSLFPVDFTLASWKYIIGIERIWKSVFITAIVTVIGTFVPLFLNSIMAYPLAKKEFAPAPYILMGILGTMVFKAPIIPYFLVVRRIGLYDSFWVMILPGLFGAYNLIMMVTFMREIPAELEESAKIEGAGYMQILFRIILPVSKAMLATIGLFYAVSQWNMFTHPLLFLENVDLFPIQMIIRAFVTGDEAVSDTVVLSRQLYSRQTVQCAVILFCILPILMVYPFIQKYFIKGAMIGSIKG
jgi:putative aldouronate transport system permease protein